MKTMISLSCILFFSANHAMAEWSPIGLAGFTSNATDPWISPPNGESAPRQGWLGTPDGFFTKEWHLTGAYNKGAQDVFTGSFQFHLPLTRRFWVGADVPFIINKGDKTDFGDFGLTVKTMFHETQNLSISGGLGARFATGEEATGGKTWALNPHVSMWSDIGSGWSIRGGSGFDILPETEAKPSYTYTGTFAIGQTITPHSATFGDFTYYLATNIKVPLDNNGSNNNNVRVTLTPGLRTHIANNTFLLLGVDVPVTSTSDTYDYQVNLKMVKGF